MKPLIVIAGATGFIGGEYIKYFCKNNIKYHQITREGILKSNLKRDLSDLASEYQKMYFINATGFTGKPNVDACELNKTDCLYVNGVLPGEISRICQELGVVYCHVSSGCVYNGYDKIFNEKDEPNFTFRQNNCSFYSGSKAMGEEIIASNPNKYVWRLRIPFNSDLGNPRNYLNKIIRYPILLNTPNSITYIEDFIFTTYQMIVDNAPLGTYNIVNDGSVEARDILDILCKKGKFNGVKEYYKNIEDFSKTVVSPRSNCLLDNTKIKNLGFCVKNSYDIIENFTFQTQ